VIIAKCKAEKKEKKKTEHQNPVGFASMDLNPTNRERKELRLCKLQRTAQNPTY